MKVQIYSSIISIDTRTNLCYLASSIYNLSVANLVKVRSECSKGANNTLRFMHEVSVVVNLEVLLLQFAFVSVEYELDSTVKR